MTQQRHTTQTDSTNADARRALAAGELTRTTHFRADIQTAGVGRRGTPWHSPLGGLWLTIARPITTADHTTALGLRVGCACLAALDTQLPLHTDSITLKWPNDLLIAGRKALGCMTESLTSPSGDPWILVGIGCNTNNPPPKLHAGHAPHPPTSLGAVTGTEHNLAELQERLAQALEAALKAPLPAILKAVEPRLHNLGNPLPEDPTRTLVGLTPAGEPRYHPASQ